MQKFSLHVLVLVFVLFFLTPVACRHAFAQERSTERADVSAAMEAFRGLDRSYATAPLWVWNDLMTEEGVRRHLTELAEQGVRQVFVHPRPGLMTAYLEEDWFRVFNASLEAAEELDMNIWIYDENSYPSGFAGGLVPEAMPEAREQGLSFQQEKKRPTVDQDTVAVYLVKDGRPELVTDQVKAGSTPEEADYLVARRAWGPASEWYAGKFYVDLLKPGVTEKFLDITLGAYKEQVGDQFGKRIPGCFTDEPRLSHVGQFYWNDELPKWFEERWGYSLLEHLPELTQETGDWRRTRHNFNHLLNERFVERWCKPYSACCAKHGLEMTGHYWEHGWPGCRTVPDNMAAAVWEHRPGIDILLYNYDQTSPGAQFGNVRSVKEVASVANQAGRNRTLCEAYGASGWAMRFEDLKRYADWLLVLGVNTIDEHLSYSTLRGARKYDHPLSFSYHEPWWKDYHVLEHYYTRLCAALSSGEQVNHVLLIEPTTTAWLYQENAPEPLMACGNAFQAMVTDLELAQAECDLASESVIRHFGNSQTPGHFSIGQRDYDLVLIPPKTENLDHETVELLTKYIASGGTVLCCDEPPSRVDGKVSEEVTKLAASPNWKKVDVRQAIEAAVARTAQSGLAIQRAGGDRGILFHHRRQLADGELVLLVNTSIEHPTSATITADAQSAQVWDAFTGGIGAYPCEVEGETLKAAVNLPPCGSLLLFLSDEKLADEEELARSPVAGNGENPSHATGLTGVGPMTATRLGPNVLTLDFVDVAAGGETKPGMAVVDATNWVFQKNGYPKNPWQHAVQFHDENLKHEFPAESGFTATYRFTIDGKVPGSLELVIERADLYAITCNGKPVQPIQGRWWLDRSFGVIDLSGVVQNGPNEVTIAMKPMTTFGEVANAYLIGDFSLEPSAAGFVIQAARPVAVPTQEENGKTPSWRTQGMPFYAEGVAYEQTFNVETESKGRYVVELPAWYGSVARIFVDGEPAGHITHRPWRCEVTSQIKPGKNTVRVEIIGTLANTLGPHHWGTPTPWVGPFSFGGCPEGPPVGEKYFFNDYGLFGPIELKQLP